MYRKQYIGHHGYSTFIRGVWTESEDGERAVHVTETGREDDEIAPGQTLTLAEIHSITGTDEEFTDVFSFAGRSAALLVA